MQKSLTSVAASCCLLSMVHSAQAGVTLTATAVSDYTLNGISQTQGDAALQVSLDWAGDSGLYVGAWTSNVDFGEGDNTSNEIDLYIGKYWQLNDTIGLDLGLAYYTYHGASYSDDFDYPEVYANFGFNTGLGASELIVWYTNDYGGLDASHYTVKLTHKVQVAEGHDIKFTFDRSTSQDEDKFAWGGTDIDTYDHYRAEYITSWKDIDISLAVEDTDDIDEEFFDADSGVVLSVGKTFSF